MKTRLWIILIIGFAGFFSFQTQTNAEECIPVEIKYSRYDENLIEFCNLDESNILVGTTNSSSLGIVSIEVPRKVVDSVFGNCEPDTLIVLINGLEVKVQQTIKPTFRTLEVEFPVGEIKLEIVGSFPLVFPLPTQYCGSSHGYDSKYAPPLKQVHAGVPLSKIMCNEGLNPVVKRDRITPACVTDSTWNELLTRGWALLRLGIPAETNILITYDAIAVYPQQISKELDPHSPFFNMIFWVNNDFVPHSINAEDQSWSSGIIESGQVGSVSFNHTGIYKYYVKEKPQTSGTIVFEKMVEPEPEPEPIPELESLLQQKHQEAKLQTQKEIMWGYLHVKKKN